MKIKPLMICLEGIIGSGKTTQIGLLSEHLGEEAVTVPELSLFQPLKEAIQRVKKKNSESGKIRFERESVVDLARARRVVQIKLFSNLPKRKYILADRSVYTSIAYEAGELAWQEIEDINLAEDVIFPDLGLVLDCSTEEALSRVDKRRISEGIYKNRSPNENLYEMKKTRQIYLELVRQHNGLELIDANRPCEEIFNDIQGAIKKWE